MPRRLGGLASPRPGGAQAGRELLSQRRLARAGRRRKRDPDYAAAKARAKPGERLILDHKRERKDGGADLDPANTSG
jgi:5-methylcytosine-specific restriction protein A